MSGETGRAHRRESRLVVGPVVHRVVRDVDDVVATGRAIGQDRGDARHGVRAAIDDAVEIDQQQEAHRPIVAVRPVARTMARMPAHSDRDPLAATTTPARRRDEPAPRDVEGARAPRHRPRSSAACVARSRPSTTIELVFDGPPERGLRNERIAAGLVVRYSGGRTADAVILTIIDDVRMLDGADGSAALLVVTDDRDLRHGAQMRGARTARSAWLLGRLGTGRLASPSVGNPRPARGAKPADRGQPAGRRSGRDRPAVVEAGTRRDDQEGQSAQGAQGGRD